MQAQTAAQSATPDLASILAAAAAGGPEAELAWKTILDRYARRVFAMAHAHLKNHNDAQDITQAVFASVASTLARGTYTEQGRFESFLFRVTMNRVRDEARRLKRHARPADPTSLANIRLAPVDERASEDELETLKDALESLPEADRQIIQLRHHAELSFQQIADTLEQPLGTVLARHHRALRKLRKIMEAATP